MAGSRRGVGAAALVALCLIVGACTPSPGETPSPTPSPSTASPTPTETAIERQERLDYAAAEKSYRTFQAELRRVLRDGGKEGVTVMMKQTTGGEFLKETESVVTTFRSEGYHQRGTQKVVFVRPTAHSTDKLLMDICEDGRGVSTYNRNEQLIGTNDLRRSEITFRKSSSAWKIWSASGRKVTTCE